MNYENELLSFCEGKIVFVYGSGKNQKKIKAYLINRGIDVRGFIVSDSHFQDASYEIRISDLFKYCNKDDNYGIVVAVTEKYYNEIVRNIYNAGIDINKVFITPNAIKQEVIQGDMYSDISINRNKDIEKEYDRFKEYYKYIVNKCKENEYNLLCHLHLGDTLFFLLLKEKFEEHYGFKIHYILQKKQTALAHLCKIDNYSIDEYDFFNDETGAYRFNVREISSFKNGVYVNVFSTLPQINIPFVASQIPWLNEKYKWGTIVKAWSAALGINEERLDPPKMQLEMSLGFRDKLNSIADLNNIVLLAPDARANNSVPDTYWTQLIKALNGDGKTVIVNTLDKSKRLDDVIYMDMTLNDLLALGMACHSVYSSRSGLCDCLVAKGSKLNVIYPKGMHFNYYSLNNNFNVHEPVTEMVL